MSEHRGAATSEGPQGRCGPPLADDSTVPCAWCTLSEDRVAQGLCRTGRGMGRVGRELPLLGVTGPPAEQLYKSFQGGTTYLVPDTSWASNALSCHVFLFPFFPF